MKKYKIITFIILAFSLSVLAYAKQNYDTDTVIKSTAGYIYETVKEPTVASTGGEWVVLGLSRSGVEVPDEYYADYYERVEEYVKEKKGVLHTKKYTEYSRVILALSSIGKNPENVAGYNLISPLGDYEKTIWQGINGPAWALIALDCKNYDIPKNKDAKIQATREMYVNYILTKQLPDGGWALTGSVSDPDVTAMVLQALSNYQNNSKVKTATSKALICLSNMQNTNGGFSTFGQETSESSVQVLVALCSLGIDPQDSRFVKNGKSVLDSVLSYSLEGGAFCHTQNGGENLMATEQALYGLVAYKRFSEDKKSLYSMGDAIPFVGSNTSDGLKNKHKDIKKKEIIYVGKTFSDVSNLTGKEKIEALVSRGIINGKTRDTFDPNGKMTRAEFATITVKSLGLSEKSGSVFSDVKKNDWFYGYVYSAFNYGIIKGVSENKFSPGGTITREETAVMIMRSAALCGMNTELSKNEVRNILCVFPDYVKASEWSQNALAFCFKEGIMSDEVSLITPKESVTRKEIAELIYNLLDKAKLL